MDFPCGWTNIYIPIYIYTLRLFGNCFSCLKTTNGKTGRAKKKVKRSVKVTSKTVTGNILKVMVSKLLLNEIRHIKMSGSLSLFIALGWFYVAYIRRKSNNSPPHLTPILFYPLFALTVYPIYLYIYSLSLV